MRNRPLSKAGWAGAEIGAAAACTVQQLPTGDEPEPGGEPAADARQAFRRSTMLREPPFQREGLQPRPGPPDLPGEFHAGRRDEPLSMRVRGRLGEGMHGLRDCCFKQSRRPEPIMRSACQSAPGYGPTMRPSTTGPTGECAATYSIATWSRSSPGCRTFVPCANTV
jgi:hypothetical protein